MAQLNSPALVVFNVRETYGILIQTLHGISKDWGACFFVVSQGCLLGKAYKGLRRQLGLLYNPYRWSHNHTLRIQTLPIRVGLMVKTSHPQVIGLVRGNPGFLGHTNGSLQIHYNLLKYVLFHYISILLN